MPSARTANSVDCAVPAEAQRTMRLPFRSRSTARFRPIVSTAPGWFEVLDAQSTWLPTPYSTRLPSPCRISRNWPFGEVTESPGCSVVPAGAFPL